jgi:hypothetical protein
MIFNESWQRLGYDSMKEELALTVFHWYLIILKLKIREKVVSLFPLDFIILLNQVKY